MINLRPILKFNNYEGEIFIPSGINVLGSGQVIHYPEYKGNKDNMFDFYKTWAEGNNLSAFKLNDTMYTIIDNVQYLYQ